MNYRVIIGIGSNIHPEENIYRAIDLLKQHTLLLKKSSFIETEPIGFTEQANFINGAVLIETEKSVDELKNLLHEIENQLGRIRTENKFGPRTIDLDIIMFDGIIIDKDFYTRDFLKKSVEELTSNAKLE